MEAVSWSFHTNNRTKSVTNQAILKIHRQEHPRGYMGCGNLSYGPQMLPGDIFSLGLVEDDGLLS